MLNHGLPVTTIKHFAIRHSCTVNYKYVGAGVPLRATGKANLKALKKNLPSWFEHVVKLLFARLNCRIPCNIEDNPQNWLGTWIHRHKDTRLRRRESLGLDMRIRNQTLCNPKHEAQLALWTTNCPFCILYFNFTFSKCPHLTNSLKLNLIYVFLI